MRNFDNILFAWLAIFQVEGVSGSGVSRSVRLSTAEPSNSTGQGTALHVVGCKALARRYHKSLAPDATHSPAHADPDHDRLDVHHV
jgi:hypothetical protein